MNLSFWSERPGLAGGIDKDGGNAAALLASGFGSVEFGTVTAQPAPGHNPGVAALVEKLAALDGTQRCGTKIGVSLGAGSDAAPSALAAEWLAGMDAAWPVADYLCFNLSARAYRPLLTAQHTGLLTDAIATILRQRARLGEQSGRRVAVALKLPLGVADGHWPGTLQAIAGMGLDAMIAVLPEGDERLRALSGLASLARGETMLLAVGGVRTAEDVRAVLAAGAQGIQVHSAFVERGIDCLPPLLAGMPALGSAREAP